MITCSRKNPTLISSKAATIENLQVDMIVRGRQRCTFLVEIRVSGRRHGAIHSGYDIKVSTVQDRPGLWLSLSDDHGNIRGETDIVQA